MAGDAKSPLEVAPIKFIKPLSQSKHADQRRTQRAAAAEMKFSQGREEYKGYGPRQAADGGKKQKIQDLLSRAKNLTSPQEKGLQPRTRESSVGEQRVDGLAHDSVR